MFFTALHAATILVALSSTTSWALPSSQHQVDSSPGLEVPWKRQGLSLSKKDGGYSFGDKGCSHCPEGRGCWNGEFDIDTDPDLKWPITGKTVKYHLEITNETMAPDGFAKTMMVFNGQFPGPTIVADWGDDIEISVTNNLETNGTGVHWHGLRHLGSNEMDGTNGITECPIAPGKTKIYRFRATQYGSSWYHSHYSVQYGDGLVGNIIINGPATANYDIDLGVLPFMDWFHASAFTVNHAALHASGPPTADNLLVNGTMPSAYGGKYAETILTPGKLHRLRLANTGMNNNVHVGLDGHPFTVIAADFTPIEPYTTTSVNIAVGQRYDVIINASQPVDNYWLRVGTGGRCDGPNANSANLRSIFRYAGAEITEPTSSPSAILPTGCYDEDIVPWVKTQVPQDMPKNIGLNFTNTAVADNLVQWLVDGVPLLIDFDKPTLQTVFDGFEGNETWNPSERVYIIDEAHEWQYWVIQQAAGTTPPLPHPIHLHGHDFWVLDQQANAQWSGDISRLKTNNPIRRDTATLPAGGYLVLAFLSNNPGAWLMHCHIPFHVSAGFGLQFVEQISKIRQSNGNFGAMQEGCKEWQKFHSENYPDGILIDGDSGLR